MWHLQERIKKDLFGMPKKGLEEYFLEPVKDFICDTNVLTREVSFKNSRKSPVLPKNNTIQKSLHIFKQVGSILEKKANIEPEPDFSALPPLVKQSSTLSEKEQKMKIERKEKSLFIPVSELRKAKSYENSKDSKESEDNKDMTTMATSAETESKVEHINKHEKEEIDNNKILNIFYEIKDKYFPKKDALEKVYAVKLEKDQLHSLFAKYVDDKVNDCQEFYSSILKGDFLVAAGSFLGKKSKRKDASEEEKTFFTRRNICLHLSKVVNKLVPEMTKNVSHQLVRMIESNILKESNTEISWLYEKNVKQLFNNIKTECLNQSKRSYK